MNILTTEGYKDIEDVNINDEIIGINGINILENKRTLDKEWFVEQGLGNEWKWYLINDKYTFFYHQNIFVGQGEYNLCHTFELQIGWTILNKEGIEEEIISINEVEGDDVWWKLDINNDHSFISQDIQLHNASRYWVGGGSTANWTATANTNWSATSGGSNNASVPGSTDDVFFDGVGTNGNTNSTISANISILSFTSTSGYTATITRNANLQLSNGGNLTLHKNTQWTGTGQLTLSGAQTITANGFSAGDTFWSNALTFTGAYSTTLVSASGDIKIGGNTLITGGGRVINSSGVTFSLNGITLQSSVSGTAKIILTGGTWTASTILSISNNLDLQGNITLSNNVSYLTGTLKYVSGTITVTNSTLTIAGSSTLDTNGVTWNNINTTPTTGTITLASDLTCSSNLSIGGITNNTLNINGNNFYIGGNFTMNTLGAGIIAGTTNIIMNGSSPTISMISSSTGAIRNNIEFAHSGVCTITGNAISGLNGGFRYQPATSGTSTLKFTSGTISISDRLRLLSNTSATTILTCNTSGVTLDYVEYRSSLAHTYTVNGTNGLSFGTLDLTYNGNSNNTITFKFGNTYTVNTLFKTDISGLASTNQTSKFTIVSDTPGSKVAFKLSQTASQGLYHVDFTDVDASTGHTIYTYDGLDNLLTLSNVSNIKRTPTGPITVVY